MTLAVIGGSGFQDWERLQDAMTQAVSTPYATESVQVLAGSLDGHGIVFLPRHGPEHGLPPHRINYRANLWALKELDVAAVVALATVGGISRAAAPGVLLVPDQVLDYTYGRAQTFYDGDDGVVGHVDMSEPYCGPLRRRIIEAGERCEINVVDGGTYAATQGPRFETAAEIARLERDGADVVGMTGMPEAALAKELQLPYAAIAMVVNPAAGKVEGGISMAQVRQCQSAGRANAEKLLAAVVSAVRDDTFEVAPPLIV